MTRLYECADCHKELPAECFNFIESQEGRSVVVCRYCQDGKELDAKEKAIEGMMREAGI